MKKYFVVILFLYSNILLLDAQTSNSPIEASGQGGNGLIFSFVDNSGKPLSIPDSMLVLSYILTASGGEPISGYTWTLSSGSTFPPGVTVEPLTGVLKSSGASLIAGSYQFKMTVSDDEGNSAQETLNFIVRQDSNTVDFLNSLLSDVDDTIYVDPVNTYDIAYTGIYYSASVGAELGYKPAPLHWSIYSGSLPPGLVLDAARGVIRGTPLSGDENQTYTFSIKITDTSGREGIGPDEQISVYSNPTFIRSSPKVPLLFKLNQNYPNPFNPTTTIKYQIPQTSYVTLKVYNILGNETAALVDKVQQAGNYSIEYGAGSKDNIAGLSSGVYFYKLTAVPVNAGHATSFSEVKKLLFLK